MKMRCMTKPSTAAAVALAFGIAGVLMTVSAPLAQAQKFNSLYSFTGSPDGETAYGTPILSKSGALYGTTRFGGSSNMGTIYKLSKGKETVLHSFSGSDGSEPFAGVVMDKSGTLYGTTPYGGGSNVGTVFALSSKGTFTTLYSFTGGADGSEPFAGLLIDAKGNLYGATEAGGSAGAGTIFEVEPKSKKEIVLYSFAGGANGANPLYGYLVADQAGNLYGTTVGGGADGNGTVWELSAKGKQTVLYSFTGGTDGGGVFEMSLATDNKGNLYGTTEEGGTSEVGTVFKVNIKAKTEKVLYNFTGSADGASPSSGLVRDSKGNLYGSTQVGGTNDEGVVFEVTGTKETVLETFDGSNGAVPFTAPLLDDKGTLYGVTSYGGTDNDGTVFSLKP
jgi:uncharacterized repeat protein (TIGR03803 family)